MVKKILVWRDKHGSSYWDASNPESELQSYLKIFKCMDDIGYYWEFNQNAEDEIKNTRNAPHHFTMKVLYKKAKEGDSKAAKELIRLRRSWEYEEVKLEEVD